MAAVWERLLVSSYLRMATAQLCPVTVPPFDAIRYFYPFSITIYLAIWLRCWGGLQLLILVLVLLES